MRILFYCWKTYNQRAVIACLRQRGHEVDEFFYEMANFEADSELEVAFRDKLEACTYDAVFSINYFPGISDVCEEKGVKYICWTCDSPLSTMHHQSIFNSCNYVFSFDKYTQVKFNELGAKMYYLPLASGVCPLDEPENGQKKEQDNHQEKEQKSQQHREYSSDITFIGSMYKKNSYDEIEDKLPDYVRGYFDALMKLQMEIYGENYIDKMLDGDILYELSKHFRIEKSERSFSDISLTFSTTVLGFKIARMERLYLLNELSKRFQVNVYTDEAEAELPLANNLGKADYWSESAEIFRSSRINLNFTIRNIQSGIPLRVWDILACGGFLITNFQPELPLYFENGVDLVWFEDAKDLVEKCAYCLAHEEEREKIAANGYRKVSQLHTMEKRIKKIGEVVQLDL